VKGYFSGYHAKGVGQYLLACYVSELTYPADEATIGRPADPTAEL